MDITPLLWTTAAVIGILLVALLATVPTALEFEETSGAGR